MAPSLSKIGAAVLACSTSVAAIQSYQLFDSYNASNFFDKFDFFESKYGTANYNDVDPTSGYINYRSQQDANDLGLIAYQGEEIFMGVNHKDVLNNTDPNGKGRDSVRIESKARYTHGLFIADFTHLPKPTCGVWPAL